MEDLSFNEPDNIFTNPKDLGVCKHEWNFLITSMKDSNLFIEACNKCNMSVRTLEVFKD